jgi:hypothetical protein
MIVIMRTPKILNTLVTEKVHHTLADALNLAEELDSTLQLEELISGNVTRTRYYPEVNEYATLDKPIRFSAGDEGIFMHAGGQVVRTIPHGSKVSMSSEKGITLAIPQETGRHHVSRVRRRGR